MIMLYSLNEEVHLLSLSIPSDIIQRPVWVYFRFNLSLSRRMSFFGRF